ncbi:hypothetical protein TEA_004787 [Camellia sinensis var. sinensis]|uniref:Uncharacterized protein n=1 Tax=Camellia sinensis var. sinensis TaxID=542762 RepID=A0A4S4DNQ5_CAMSN|nr:hypothetical protein TEA_004787 [Camellia sinensis var. sinensis]
MKLYIDCCKELSEPPNLKLLKKLYNLEVSELEVILSDCELQDVSITPLLNALQAHKTVSVLDLSHNLLGNGTVEKLQQVFTSSGQRYGSLVLDLHCNRFGPTALFQICECPVLFARLEVLNISSNRLTDACGFYLSTILQNCKALYSLNIERCSITSRTIQKVADSLGSESVLSQICLGYNNPISSNAIVNLLAKLASLKRFSELNLNGLKLSKHVVDGLCQLSQISCLSTMMLGDTSIGTDGALQLIESLSNGTHELMKLDLSSCGLTSQYIVRLNDEVSLISSIAFLWLIGGQVANRVMPHVSEIKVGIPGCVLPSVFPFQDLITSHEIPNVSIRGHSAAFYQLDYAAHQTLGTSLVIILTCPQYFDNLEPAINSKTTPFLGGTLGIWLRSRALFALEGFTLDWFHLAFWGLLIELTFQRDLALLLILLDFSSVVLEAPFLLRLVR